MKSSIRKALIILLSAVLLISSGMTIYHVVEQLRAEQTYSEAETLVDIPDFEEISAVQNESEIVSETWNEQGDDSAQQLPEEEPVYVDPYADELSNMDFTALREVNSDILGWILIPNTRISYPLVQGEDNDYYLKRTWRKTKSDVGSIFMEYQCSEDLSDFNTIIYGHRMNNGSMFGSLKNYSSTEYLKAHPMIYITNNNGAHVYEIFSVYEADVTGLTYRIGQFTDAEKQNYIDWCLEQSTVDCGVIPKITDQIVTLSTCTGRGGYETRWVVQGVMRGVHTAVQETTSVNTK